MRSSGWHTVGTMRWLLVFRVLLLCSGQPASPPCPLQMSPASAVVRFGDSIRITCNSTADDIATMGLESSYGSETTKGLSSVALNITSVNTWDVLTICFLNRRNADQCLKKLPVTVYKTPDRVSISQPGLLVEGETYSLKCDVVNVAPVRNLSVLWYQGEKNVLTQRFDGSSLSPVNATSVFNLTARRAHVGDRNQIRCEAQLDFWTTVPSLLAVKSESLPVVVLYPPTFAEPENQTLELPAGAELTLHCDATGNPPPVYSWQGLDAAPLADLKENKYVLAPSSPLPSTYKCTASNSRGSTSKYFTVTQAPGNKTTLAALLGVFLFLAVVISIGGIWTLTPKGTFSLSKGGSAPI